MESLRCNAAAPSAKPAIAPPRDSRRLSASSWRTMRRGLAPNEHRTAISRRRSVVPASRRFARFAQAINSTIPAAPNSSSTGARTSPTRSRASGRTTVPLRSLSCGLGRGRPSRSAQKSALVRSTSRAMDSGVCPGVSRPIADQHQQLSDWGSMPNGIHSSLRLGNSNPGRITPTTVVGMLLRLSAWPMIAESPAKRRCQNA